MTSDQTIVDDATLDFAKALVGTTWIPIRRQRLDLEMRIAEALADAEARARAAERNIDRELDQAVRAGEQKGYEAAKLEMRSGW